MKLRFAFHTCCYYSPSRLPYLREQLKLTTEYPHDVSIFIHTNREFPASEIGAPENLKLNFVVHRDLIHWRLTRVFCNWRIIKLRWKLYKATQYLLSKVGRGEPAGVYEERVALQENHPYYLTHRPRELMASQKDDFDVFIYTEEDIGIPWSAINYWLNHKDLCKKHDVNLGFLRIECRASDQSYYASDLGEPLSSDIQTLDGMPFVVNDVNPYCAFWICDQEQFHEFLDSPYWDLGSHFWRNDRYPVRESSAIGMHGLFLSDEKNRYKTVLPLNGQEVVADCAVFHLQNNYIDHDHWCQFQFPINVEHPVRREDK